MSDSRIERPEEEAPDKSWQPQLSWTALLLAGWLLYEYTAQPGLAAAVTCAKFGWGDWRAALWLRRVDPDARRGRTCFWFYLAYGLWKVALMAGLVMVLLLFVTSHLQRRRPAPGPRGIPPAAEGVLIAMGLGLGLSFLLTYFSLWSALRNRVKVWVGAAPRLARERRYWPPYHGKQNAAPFLAVCTFILTWWFVVLGTALVILHLGLNWLTYALGALVLLTSPLTLFVLKYLERRIFARTPEDCWDPEEIVPVRQADDPDAVALVED